MTDHQTIIADANSTTSNTAPLPSIADLGEIARAKLAEADERLVSLRRERDRLNERIATTVAERDEAARYVKAITPRTRKAKAES